MAADRGGRVGLLLEPVFVVGHAAVWHFPGRAYSGVAPLRPTGPGRLQFWYRRPYAHAKPMCVWDCWRGRRHSQRLAEDYLRLLETRARDASRIVDKTPVNSDYIEPIHSVFPNARFIFMGAMRSILCLSCYFQQFVATMSYFAWICPISAHYHKGALCRLIRHLAIRCCRRGDYDRALRGLVSDQQVWTRKMLDFLGLEWDDRCLSFQDTQRVVVTSSAWQVRQKIYSHSVVRSQALQEILGASETLRN